jgi:hypothetical protein
VSDPVTRLNAALAQLTLDVGRQTSAPNADAREARAPVWSRDGTETFYQSGGAVVSVPVSTDGGFTSGSPEVVVVENWLEELRQRMGTP